MTCSCLVERTLVNGIFNIFMNDILVNGMSYRKWSPEIGPPCNFVMILNYIAKIKPGSYCHMKWPVHPSSLVRGMHGMCVASLSRMAETVQTW